MIRGYQMFYCERCRSDKKLPSRELSKVCICDVCRNRHVCHDSASPVVDSTLAAFKATAAAPQQFEIKGRRSTSEKNGTRQDSVQEHGQYDSGHSVGTPN